jgi:hypothetical protein
MAWTPRIRFRRGQKKFSSPPLSDQLSNKISPASKILGACFPGIKLPSYEVDFTLHLMLKARILEATSAFPILLSGVVLN